MIGKKEEINHLKTLYNSNSFEYIDKKTNKRTAIIIDEFPFLADENPTIKSVLQHTIDHLWKKNSNIFLILCGSSVSFMETDVMGNKSPLHDRQKRANWILFLTRWDNCGGTIHI